MAIIDDYRLTDRYEAERGRVFVSGVQALARIPVEQLRVDRAAGLDTAAFVSGYPGSPLAGFDGEIGRAASLAPDLPIVCRPALNEELAATSVMGTQLVANQPDARYEGVLGIWYGKAPGLDRASDAMRHAVYAGTSPRGGAIAFVGDDPAAKSSTLPSSSDFTLVDLQMPILYPGDVQEVVDLGRHAVALSRMTGLWVGMKIVAAVADGTGTIDLDPDRVRIVEPDLTIDGERHVHTVDAVLVPPHNLLVERDLREVRSRLARRYAAANELNRITIDPADPWVTILASGYTYHELLEALRRLGLDGPAEIAGAGIRLVQMRMPHPFDTARMREVVAGVEEVIVVEEKNPTLELLVKDALYNASHHPTVVGKTDEDGTVLQPSHGILDADAMVAGLRRRLDRRLADRLAPPPPPPRERTRIPVSVTRTPAFCSGCPHNWGTKVPDGSLVGAGIGCHTMVLLMDPERVGDISGLTAMGGEGAQWIGMAPFVERAHCLQNIGDGTFSHSGMLAIRAAAAAGVRITYKLLYNGAVAMTGGQAAVGAMTVPDLAAAMLRHGVKRVIVTTEDVADYRGVDLPDDEAGRIEVWDRRRIVEAQEVLAGVDGVTLLIHDQACAAEARRARKRGVVPTPTRRVVINHRLCEACGDCGVVSNCLSVQPIDTPLGVKTTIDQASCNLDFSCLGGDCPSFMTVEPADDVPAPAAPAPPDDLPAPPAVAATTDEVGVRIVGIGGTGVVTAAQVIATAAMLDGAEVRGLDQTGLSQKAGAVVSDLRLARSTAPASNLLGEATADVLLGFDLLTASTPTALASCREGETVLVGSCSATPTASMVGHPEVSYPTADELLDRIGPSVAAGPLLPDAGRLSAALTGNAATANLFVVGVAVQAGALPISVGSVETAIALNGVAVEQNVAAFRWGRAWTTDAAGVEDAARSGPGDAAPDVVVDPLSVELARRVAALGGDAAFTSMTTMLVADLVAYQDARYASRFLDAIEEVVDVEATRDGGPGRLATAVARSLHKLMAYKDEYEVARLLTGSEARRAAEAVGGPGATVSWRLHPPLLKALGLEDKLSIPEKVGRPLMLALRHGKRLRGTKLDPFGRTELRRAERAIVGEYLDAIRAELGPVRAGLPAGGFDRVVEIAEAPLDVRGYEELKLRRIAELRARLGDRAAERAGAHPAS